MLTSLGQKFSRFLVMTCLGVKLSRPRGVSPFFEKKGRLMETINLNQVFRGLNEVLCSCEKCGRLAIGAYPHQTFPRVGIVVHGHTGLGGLFVFAYFDKSRGRFPEAPGRGVEGPGLGVIPFFLGLFCFFDKKAGGTIRRRFVLTVPECKEDEAEKRKPPRGHRDCVRGPKCPG